MKKTLFRLALAVVVGAAAVLLLRTTAFEATADGEPYSVSLNSPVTFPVDI